MSDSARYKRPGDSEKSIDMSPPAGERASTDGLYNSLSLTDFRVVRSRQSTTNIAQAADLGSRTGARAVLPQTTIEHEALSNFYAMKLPEKPLGLEYPAKEPGALGRYVEPKEGTVLQPKGVDSRVWHGVKHRDGSVALSFRGCAVDTDGSGAHRHPEDRTRQSRTSLRNENGSSLDTDRDSFFVLPKSVARAYGIKKGDLGWLVQKDSGKAVPVVFGDVGPEGKLGEASVKALKDLGYKHVNGARGVSGDRFEVVFVPGTGNGKGDIARDSAAMAARLGRAGVPGWKS